MKRLLSIMMLILCCLQLQAARERNYIFLFDCTKSMIGYNGTPNVMAQTQNFLEQNIAPLPDETMVHVVMFQDKICQTVSCLKRDYNHADIVDKINKFAQSVTHTDLCSAWTSGEKLINPAKDNYLVLITDGEDNVKGIGALTDLLSKFCGKYPNTHAFYVTLTKNALKNGDAKTERMIETINLCDDIDLVDVSDKIQVFGDLGKDHIKVSTLSLPKKEAFSFSAMGNYKASVRCSDPHFKVEVENGMIKGGQFNIMISSKYGNDIKKLNSALQSDKYNFEFDVVIDPNENIRLVNPHVFVTVDNREERSLVLNGFEEDGILQEEIKANTDTWYDSFLFMGADEHEKISIDLKPLFNSGAKKEGSVARLKVSVLDEDGKETNKCQLFYNDKELNDNILTINTSDNDSELSLFFNDECCTGKHYIRLTDAGSAKMDYINQKELSELNLSIRTAYHTIWNPLKTGLLIFIIAVIVLLIIWFLIAKPSMYPSIKVGYLTITDPYHKSRKIKGKRMVVCTNKMQNQSFLSRAFTGEILYEVDDVWTHPLELTPKKKSLRLKLGKVYLSDESALVPNGEEVEVENLETGAKAKLSCN